LRISTKHEIEIPKKVNNEVILKQIELQNENFIAGIIDGQNFVSLLMVWLSALNVTVNALLNPESNIVLEKNDILWIVGNKN
jgi:CPA2 family monovalent cation:H+ antiporter-2